MSEHIDMLGIKDDTNEERTGVWWESSESNAHTTNAEFKDISNTALHVDTTQHILGQHFIIDNPAPADGHNEVSQFSELHVPNEPHTETKSTNRVVDFEIADNMSWWRGYGLQRMV